jgi:hypothetical protein
VSPKKRSSRLRSAKSKPTPFNLTRLREDVDTYTEGIYATLAFINKAQWCESKRRLDTSISYGVGRRFTASKGNRIVPERTEVTPDCAVQLTPTHGVVAEAKPGVTRLKAAWDDRIRQLQKYDDDLQGWWTPSEQCADHDIVVLIPMTRAYDFIELLKEQIASGDATFVRPLCVVGFFKHTGAQHTYFTLKIEFGSVRDSAFDTRLRRAQSINWSPLISSGGDRKFMDSEPPLAYTLWILWDMVLPVRAAGRPPEAKQNWIAVDVSVADLTADVQRFYGFPSTGARSVEIPRQKWIRKALDSLVVFGMCERTDDAAYRVRYARKRRTKDTLQYFGELCHRHRDRLARTFAVKPLLAMAEGLPAPASEAAPIVADDTDDNSMPI